MSDSEYPRVHYSTISPSFLTTAPQRAWSDLSVAAASSGVEVIGVSPIWAKRSCNYFDFTAATVVELSRVTMSRGSPAGPSSIAQVATS